MVIFKKLPAGWTLGLWLMSIIGISVGHSINENLLFPSSVSEDKLRTDELYGSITFSLKDIAFSQF